MKCEQAKKIPIDTFLARLNQTPAKIQGYDLWYRSPLRDGDDTPSFKVNTAKNTWYDFGLSEGGTIIDLVCLMYKETISGALHRLNFGTFEPIHKTPVNQLILEKKNPLKLVSVSKITESSLIFYLVKRKINLDIANKFLLQANFIREPYSTLQYALAFKNDSGSYEIRNSIFKGFLGEEKTITTINLKKGSRVAIFEGFFDFLAYLTYYKIHDYKSSAIILNSTNLSTKVKTILNSYEFEKAFFFLDNDEAGKKAFDSLSQGLSYPFVDKSSVYKSFNDFNEFLIKTSE